MEHSTKITEKLCKNVLEDTLKVVIDYGMAKKNNKKKIDTGGYKLVYKGGGMNNQILL